MKPFNFILVLGVFISFVPSSHAGGLSSVARKGAKLIRVQPTATTETSRLAGLAAKSSQDLGKYHGEFGKTAERFYQRQTRFATGAVSRDEAINAVNEAHHVSALMSKHTIKTLGARHTSLDTAYTTVGRSILHQMSALHKVPRSVFKGSAAASKEARKKLFEMMENLYQASRNGSSEILSATQMNIVNSFRSLMMAHKDEIRLYISKDALEHFDDWFKRFGKDGLNFNAARPKGPGSPGVEIARPKPLHPRAQQYMEDSHTLGGRRFMPDGSETTMKDVFDAAARRDPFHNQRLGH